MKKTTYKINMRDGGQREVTGDVVNGIYGIDKRITQTVTKTAKGEEKISQTSSYFLTHLPTGILVTNARTKRALMEIANLPDMTDQHDMQKIIIAVFNYWEGRGWKD